MRVAKWPFNTFQGNIEKAKALVMAQHYLNKMIEEGPDHVLEAFFSEWMSLLQDVFGFDPYEWIESVVAEGIAERFRSEFTPPDEERFQKLVQKMERLVEPLLAVITLRGQTLLEQAVVLGVSAYENYIADTVTTMLKLNSRRFDKFTPELKRDLGWLKLREHGKDWKEAATTLVLESHSAFDTGKVSSLFRRMADVDDAFGTRRTEKAIQRYIEHRHLIVHRAGKINRKFKEATGVRQGLGQVVKLTPVYVERGLSELSSFVKNLQKRLEAS